MKSRNPSPLRYPGGKASLSAVLETIIYANGLQGCTYVEPFAGGAGAGLKLLCEGHVDRIIINDLDRAVYSFWNSVMRRPRELAERIHSVPLTIREWRRQREIYRTPGRRRQIDLGFAAFYLNRCNRSGIIMNGGPIGGIEQDGKWTLEARFNRDALAARVEEIAEYGDRITILCEDATALIGHLDEFARDERLFVYADPPYYVKGRELYLNHYTDDDHMRLAETLRVQSSLTWVLTYDDAPRIRQLYKGMQIARYDLRYSAHLSSAKGGEVLITPPHVIVPPAGKKLLTARTRMARGRRHMSFLRHPKSALNCSAR